MKKIILLFMLMFSFILVNASETEVNVRLEWVTNVYYNYEKDGLNYWGQFAYIYAGDKIAYCLDISQNINSSVYTKSNELQTNNLVILAGYFGYNYENNTSLKDYMATQKLIWQYLGTNVYFTTQSNGKGERIDIDDNVSRIIYKINNHAYFPLYDTDYKFNIGNTYDFMQTNIKLNEYDIINNTNNKINFTDEGMSFEAKQIGNYYFYLQTKYPKNFENEIYVAENSQKIMVIGGINNLKRKYTYEVLGGKVNINVILNGNGGGMVTENVFELYMDNRLIGTYSPNKEGNLLIEDLYLGNYKLKHITVSDGYTKVKDEYAFSITDDDLEKQIQITLNLKTINVTINKSFQNLAVNNLHYDRGVIYRIYDEFGNFVDEVITNENGNANYNFKYGNYKIVQSNVGGIDIFHDDIIINKSDFSEDLVFNIYDEYYNARIKFIVFDKDSLEPIKNLIFKINDKEYMTDECGVYVTELLNLGEYNFSNIELENYKKVDNFKYELNENSNYYVVMDEAFVDLVIYMEKEDIVEPVIPDEEEDNNEESSKEDDVLDLDEKEEEDNIEEDVPKYEYPEPVIPDEEEDNNEESSKEDNVLDPNGKEENNNEESSKEEDVLEPNEKEENIEEDISKEPNKDDSSEEEMLVDKESNVEKLPFLGVYKAYEKYFKVFSYKFFIIKFIRM